MKYNGTIRWVLVGEREIAVRGFVSHVRAVADEITEGITFIFAIQIDRSNL